MKESGVAKHSGTDTLSDLRRRAQDFLLKYPEKAHLFPEDLQHLMHELDTCQVELELQNEDLRNTQAELEGSRRRYADLYDLAPVGYFTVNERGLIIEANLTAGEMLGMTRNKLLAQPFSTFIVPDDQDKFNLHRKNLLKTGQKQSYELRLRRQDRSVFHALLETVITAENGDFQGQFLVLISDISVRKEAELATLRSLKDRYRAIVMDQNELICRFDPQGLLTFVNDAYCRYFGVDHQQILGTAFLPNIHEDDRPLVRDHFANLTQLNPDKTIEHRVVLPGGKISWQQWSGRALFDRDGNVVECQAVGRDITRRKEAENNLEREAKMRQFFMDALPCVSMLLRYHTREIVACNKAAKAVGAVPGKCCHAAWLKKKSPCPWCLAPKLWQGGEAQHAQFWSDGIHWDAFWIPATEDLYLHYAFDDTDSQKNKEALEKVHAELEQRVEERTLELQKSHQLLLHSEKLAAIGKLSASIAHEFNNPLQSVMTVIKGIEKYVILTEKEKELVALALQECQRMKNLIINLSDFHRPTSTKPAPVDCHALLDALLLLSKKDFQIRNIAVIKKYQDTVPPVIAVADQLKQVFLNLLNNAADACEGNGLLTLTTERKGQEVWIHIEDNGTGIDPQDLSHIFEPFFTTKAGRKGNGLGLSVSYGIIKNHGGRIEVLSQPGKGAKFSVLLPVA
jgi:PAS domain S-box-containing protein